MVSVLPNSMVGYRDRDESVWCDPGVIGCVEIMRVWGVEMTG